jgi:hypothetical protein
MSRQESMIKFKGKMDGISFYKKDGVYVARKASGPSRERILNDPKFERTRENMSEFAGLALASASFSTIFAPVKNLRDTKVRGRSAKLFRKMMVVDEASILGQRQVLLSAHRSNLVKMELNLDSQLNTMFTANYTATHSADRKTATITIPEILHYMVTPPPSATHFQLVQLSGILADVIYNTNANRYDYANNVLSGKSKVTFSDYLPVKGSSALSATLQTVLDVDALNENLSVIQALGILFFKKHGTAYYPSNEGKGMRIIDVY